MDLFNIPAFWLEARQETILPPNRCGNGRELTPNNLVPAERGTQWRCRRCGPIVPPPGVANGRPRLSAQVTLRRRAGRRAGMAEREAGTRYPSAASGRAL